MCTCHGNAQLGENSERRAANAEGQRPLVARLHPQTPAQHNLQRIYPKESGLLGRWAPSKSRWLWGPWCWWPHSHLRYTRGQRGISGSLPGTQLTHPEQMQLPRRQRSRAFTTRQVPRGTTFRGKALKERLAAKGLWTLPPCQPRQSQIPHPTPQTIPSLQVLSHLRNMCASM